MSSTLINAARMAALLFKSATTSQLATDDAISTTLSCLMGADFHLDWLALKRVASQCIIMAQRGDRHRTPNLTSCLYQKFSENNTE
jgi:hypothetical protein